MKRTEPEKDRFLKWGQDASKVWHILPCMAITSLDLIDHNCTAFDRYIRAGWMDDPPEGAVICPVCRGFATRIIVENNL